MAEQTSTSAAQTSTSAAQTSPSAPQTRASARTSRSAAQTSPSPEAIEAEIAVTRAHLASTIDELSLRTKPREIVRRQKESAKAKLVSATHTPEGGLRVERVGAMAAAGAAVFLVLAILHRRHHRG